MQTDFSWGKAACYIWVLQGKTKLLEWLCTRQSVCKNSTFWVISCDSCTHICQLQQQNQISCSWACWSCRFRPALWEGAPSPSGSRLPRTHYPKYSCGAWFLARTWEQEGALWDVQVPSHVLQRNTRAAQTREQIFPTPKKAPIVVFSFETRSKFNFLASIRDKMGEDLSSRGALHYLSHQFLHPRSQKERKQNKTTTHTQKRKKQELLKYTIII